MEINQNAYRTIWLKKDDSSIVQVIDQRMLPHQLIIQDLKTWQDAENAIREMIVRGAPLIGITAAYGLYLAVLNWQENKQGNLQEYLYKTSQTLLESRPTAVNLQWAIHQMMTALKSVHGFEETRDLALATAERLAQEDIEVCRTIGEHGLELIRKLCKEKKGETLNILTHCNAGWLGTVDWGTATAPIYLAQLEGLPIHVWVDETRPRNQGFNLTAWELNERKVPHTVIVDNAGGHLMQHGMVDMVIVGSDRTTRTGDVANKIGTYLKALAAFDNDIPFYVALPSSTIDWRMRDGIAEIPIEERDPKEVKFIQGWYEGKMQTVQLAPDNSPASNYGFDVTPARLVTGLITERGICEASEKGLLKLFPEKKEKAVSY